MNCIQFTVEWDKLAFPRFTTIRSYHRKKEEYYRGLVGQDFLVWLSTGRMSTWNNGRKIGTATLRSVRVVRPGELPAAELRADILFRGVPLLEWEARLLGMDRALLLEFENHTGILRRDAVVRSK